MTGDMRSLFQDIRNRLYYRVMRAGNERLSQAFYNRFASFRKWWGTAPPGPSEAWRQHNDATGVPDFYIDGKPYKGELIFPDLEHLRD